MSLRGGSVCTSLPLVNVIFLRDLIGMPLGSFLLSEFATDVLDDDRDFSLSGDVYIFRTEVKLGENEKVSILGTGV